MIDHIGFIFTNLFINDWSSDTIYFFKEGFESLKEIEKHIDTNESINEISIRLGNEVVTKTFNTDLDDNSELLENVIEEAMEEFGDMFTNEQKLALLTKIMKKYI